MWHSVCMFFDMADYPKPAEPLTIYRGATPHRARGMSWTTDPDKARWFTEYREGRSSSTRPAYVYTVVAPPDAVLADVDALEGGEGGRGEHEIVVDPRRLPKVRRLAPTGSSAGS